MADRTNNPYKPGTQEWREFERKAIQEFINVPENIKVEYERADKAIQEFKENYVGKPASKYGDVDALLKEMEEINLVEVYPGLRVDKAVLQEFNKNILEMYKTINFILFGKRAVGKFTDIII